MRNVLALVSMAAVAVCGTTVVGATGAAMRVGDLVTVVAPVPATAGQEATVLLPVAVEDAAPAVETEVMQEVEVSTVNAPVVSEVPVEVSTVNAAVVSEEVPVKARTKSKVPKGLVQPKPRRRIRPAPESKVEPRQSKRIADRGGR
jgi:hypothetical protein